MLSAFQKEMAFRGKHLILDFRWENKKLLEDFHWDFSKIFLEPEFIIMESFRYFSYETFFQIKILDIFITKFFKKKFQIFFLVTTKQNFKKNFQIFSVQKIISRVNFKYFWYKTFFSWEILDIFNTKKFKGNFQIFLVHKIFQKFLHKKN